MCAYLNVRDGVCARDGRRVVPCPCCWVRLLGAVIAIAMVAMPACLAPGTSANAWGNTVLIVSWHSVLLLLAGSATCVTMIAVEDEDTGPV